MSENISIIIILLIIIFFMPLFLDIVFRISVRRKRRSVAFYKALQMARRKNRSLIIFTSPYSGILISNYEIHKNHPHGENFTGDINEILSNLNKKSSVILFVEVLEYLEEPQITWNNALEISGNRVFSSNLENKSPKFWFDFRLKKIMNKTFYNKKDTIIYSQSISKKQQLTASIYRILFTFIPKQFFLDDPMKI